MNDTLFLKLLDEQYSTLLLAAKKCKSLYGEHGGDVSTLDDDSRPCPIPGQIRNSKGECIDDPGIGG